MSCARFVAASSRCNLVKTVQRFLSSDDVIENNGNEEQKEPAMKELSRSTSSLRVDTIAANGLGISKRWRFYNNG